MSDVHSERVRSYNMSRIKGKNTKPEMLVRKFLFSNGIRYRLHSKALPGKPDMVFPKYKKVLFIHGCFWHGHKNCRYFVVPKTRTAWWMDKINRNRKNDLKHQAQLEKAGWDVIVIWECELKPDKKEKKLGNLLKEFQKN